MFMNITGHALLVLVPMLAWFGKSGAVIEMVAALLFTAMDVS
jgi:hypothetical protein